MSAIEVFCKTSRGIRTDMIMQYRAGKESVDCSTEYLFLWNTVPVSIGKLSLVKQPDGRFKNSGTKNIWCKIDCSLLVNANASESWYANIYKYDTDNVSRTTHSFMQTIAQSVDGAQSMSSSAFMSLAPQQSFGITLTPIESTITIEEDLCFLTITCGRA